MGSQAAFNGRLLRFLIILSLTHSLWFKCKLLGVGIRIVTDQDHHGWVELLKAYPKEHWNPLINFGFQLLIKIQLDMQIVTFDDSTEFVQSLFNAFIGPDQLRFYFFFDGKCSARIIVFC